MPVEIKNLVVKTTLTSNVNIGHQKDEEAKISEKDKNLIIEESVNQVLSILERKISR